MINKNFFIAFFLLIQFFVFYFLKWNGISYFLLSEIFFLYLLTEDISPFFPVFIYFFINPSTAFISIAFIFVFHFIKSKIKISVKLSTIFFLILYFFTARYEVYIIKAVMPGFIAFVAIIYAITRMPLIQHGLSKAIFVYTVAGFVYSILFNITPFFKYEPYLMFSTDIIQLVIALTVFNSMEGFLKKELPDTDKEHYEGEA